ncbi:MAG: T9SS type A sorting domain-containing protein, partial [Ignavibacteria bacterium]|nr:T9SS type A sorting domain-containing protein [Ignavibacteria bacterium]
NISISNQNYELFQNYPNPFNSITNIKFKLKSGMLNSGFAEIKIYDITGKLIKVLTSKKYEAGEHTVRFDASGLPSGVYFYRLTAGEYNAVKKMVLIR